MRNGRAGHQGGNPFTKDTVRVELQNRSYLGELLGGNGGSVPGKPAQLLNPDLFAPAQAARAENPKKAIRRQGRNYQPRRLSGLATCARCGRSITVHGRPNGRKRMGCAWRGQGNGSTALSVFADVAEDQFGKFWPGLSLWKRSRRNTGDAAPEPDGSRQIGHEAPRCGRRPLHRRRAVAEGRSQGRP